MTSNPNKDKIPHTAEVKAEDVAYMDRMAMEKALRKRHDFEEFGKHIEAGGHFI